MVRAVRKSGMKEAPLSEVRNDLSRFLREAEKQEIIITRHGKPAGALIGNRRTIGSSIGWKPIHASFGGSKLAGPASEPAEGFACKMSTQSSGRRY